MFILNLLLMQDDIRYSLTNKNLISNVKIIQICDLILYLK